MAIAAAIPERTAAIIRQLADLSYTMMGCVSGAGCVIISGFFSSSFGSVRVREETWGFLSPEGSTGERASCILYSCTFLGMLDGERSPFGNTCCANARAFSISVSCVSSGSCARRRSPVSFGMRPALIMRRMSSRLLIC